MSYSLYIQVTLGNTALQRYRNLSVLFRAGDLSKYELQISVKQTKSNWETNCRLFA